MEVVSKQEKRGGGAFVNEYTCFINELTSTHSDLHNFTFEPSISFEEFMEGKS
jgi:hypothetical protein